MGFFKDLKDVTKQGKALGDHHGGMPSWKQGMSDFRAVTDDGGETEVLKQGQFAPLSLSEEVAVIYALTAGLLDDVPVGKVRAFEDGLRKFLASNHPDVIAEIAASPVMTPELTEKLKSIIGTFKTTVPF